MYLDNSDTIYNDNAYIYNLCFVTIIEVIFVLKYLHL